MKTGVLLVNLGTPDSPAPGDVGRYLKEFLNDPFVIDIPAPLRWLLVNVLIVPIRKFKSAKAYSTIWQERGSPLRFHLEDLAEALKKHEVMDVGSKSLATSRPIIETAMRYGSPSIQSGLERLRSQGVEQVLLFPLYPQYAESSTKSTIVATGRVLTQMNWNPRLMTIRDFFADRGHANAWVAAFEDALRTDSIQLKDTKAHILFSYHGLPERHLLKAEAQNNSGARVCLDGGSATNEESRVRKYDCCVRAVSENLPCLKSCYRAQSIATTQTIVECLKERGHWISPSMYSTAFQSRLGRTPWIRPYTDDQIKGLAEQGVEHLIVMTPSFVADCLETIEEIGDRARHDFLEAGGKKFTRVECPNAHPIWVSAVAKMIERSLKP